MNKKDAMAYLSFDEQELRGVWNNPSFERWNFADKTMTLDGEYTQEELQALLWWIEKYGGK